MNCDPLPPGCRLSDLHRSVSRLDDLSPAQLWHLLTDRQQSLLYRGFFHQEWSELSALLDEHAQSRGARGPQLSNALYVLWLNWRNTALLRMLQSGLIPEPQ